MKPHESEKANKLNTEKAVLLFKQENDEIEYKIKDFKTGEEKSASFK